MNKKTIRDINLKGKKVLVRVDFNVPLTDEGFVSDNTRIKAAIPTIEYILEKGGKVILMSHLGRPKGKFTDKYRLTPVGEELERIMNIPVKICKDCVGSAVKETVENASFDELILLENVRFHPEEENNDPGFAKTLALLADVYVNDAFGTAHRAHASTEGITKHIDTAVAGF